VRKKDNLGEGMEEIDETRNGISIIKSIQKKENNALMGISTMTIKVAS